MRATIRITWLLLSLSFLLHNVTSDDTVSTTPVSTTATSVTVVVTEIITKKTDSTTGAPPTEKPTQAPTTVKPTSAAPVTTVVTSTQPNPKDNPATTQPQTPAVTNKPAPAPTTTFGGPSAVVNDATVPAATSSTPNPTPPAATADSSGSSVVASSAATTQKPKAPVTTEIPATVAPTRPTGSISKKETTQYPNVLADASTQTQKTVAHTSNPSTTSQGDSKRGTEKTTEAVTSPEQTTLKTPEPAVITGTTSDNPSTPTKAGLPPVGPPKEVTTSSQTTTVRTTTTTTVPQQGTFSYSLNTGHETDEKKELMDVCKRLMVNLQDGNCTLKFQHHNDKIQFDSVEIRGKVKTSLAAQYYEEITKKPTDNKTLIAILASCGALLIMIVILAVCASHRRKPYNENQQHLTEELHTVENGYHDNPTLEVMEVQPEMQEKKMPLNGEFNDSWIVPMDNLPKGCEDIPEEEDTHL